MNQIIARKSSVAMPDCIVSAYSNGCCKFSCKRLAILCKILRWYNKKGSCSNYAVAIHYRLVLPKLKLYMYYKAGKGLHHVSNLSLSCMD